MVVAHWQDSDATMHQLTIFKVNDIISARDVSFQNSEAKVTFKCAAWLDDFVIAYYLTFFFESIATLHSTSAAVAQHKLLHIQASSCVPIVFSSYEQGLFILC
jgi:hypothetical protein